MGLRVRATFQKLWPGIEVLVASPPQDLAALASEGNKEAVADALNEYLSEHPLKEGQDITDLARSGKEKAIAEALKARLGKRP